MKKLLIVLAMVAFIATGTAFADHPDGFGIGVQGGSKGYWDSGYYGGAGVGKGAALSLKLPKVPIFWTLDFESRWGSTFLGIAGDYYFIDKPLVKDIFLSWYLGFGVGLNLGFGSGDTYIDVLGRIPIGLSFQFPLKAGPLDALEIYLQIVPSVGIAIMPDIHFPAGGWPVNLGIRLWF